MSKNKIIILSMVIIILAGGTAAFFYLKTKKTDNNIRNTGNNAKKETKTLSEEEIQKMKKATEEANNIYVEVKKNNDPKECLKLSDMANRDNCIEAFALTRNNHDACKLLSSENRKAGCTDTLYIQAAIKDKNISKCLLISSENIKKRCVSSLSASLKYTKEKCAELDQSLKDACINSVIMNMARSEKNSSYCSELTDEAMKAECGQIAK